MLKWIKALFGVEKVDEKIDEPQEAALPKSFHVDRMNVEEKSTPDFSKMTKLDIDIWARDELNLKLDRRRTKQHMIETIHDHLNKR